MADHPNQWFRASVLYGKIKSGAIAIKTEPNSTSTSVSAAVSSGGASAAGTSAAGASAAEDDAAVDMLMEEYANFQ